MSAEIISKNSKTLNITPQLAKNMLKNICAALLALPLAFSAPKASAEVPEKITIASWNIENFGRKKALDNEKMRFIAQNIGRYDIIAVQEISNVLEQSERGCPRNQGKCPKDPDCGLVGKALRNTLAETGRNYGLIFSPQVKDERYLFVFDRNKIIPIETRLAYDDKDKCICDPKNTGRMARQPFIGHFRHHSFDFKLMTAHTAPNRNISELEALAYFLEQELKEDEKDICILGDLNADCDYLKTDYIDIGLRGSQFFWIIPNYADTTASKTDCAYDRMILTKSMNKHFTGKWGVVIDTPEDVSDHYLVWAEFKTE